MDVRCERCNTEYDFDDDRVPEGGLAVKCSSCGHVFRVARAGGGAAFKGGEWMVRQQSGNVFSFKELTTLQRWIVERKVFRDDEISKTGKQWKRLGDIAELATFFQVVESQPQPQPQPLAPPQPAYPQAAPAYPQAAPAYPAAYPQQPLYPQGAPVAPAAAPTAVVVYPPAADAAQVAQAPSPWQGGSGSADDPFDDLPVRRGGKGKWVALLLLLLVAGGAGALYALQPPFVRDLLAGLLGGPNELAVNHLEVGYESLYRDSNAGIDAAIENFEKAVAIDPRYAEAHAGLAEAQLARAEDLREEADAQFARLDGLPEAERQAATAGVESRRSEAARRSELAFDAAKEALRLAPDSVAGLRAMADYYRYKRALEQMKPLADKARAAAPADPGLAYVLGSSVAGDAAATERAVRYFDEALEGNPGLQRARYKLARVYAARQEEDQALLQVRAILEAVPEHERAKALLAELEPPPPPVAAAPAEEPEPTEPKKLTPAQLVRMAERLRESDQPRKALNLYERAGEEEPDDPDIHTGIGWCYVDLEEPDAAIQSFRSALRLAPRLSDAHMGIAEAFRMKGNKAEAISHYKTYLDIMPGGPEASVARRMIQLLQN